MFPADLMDGFSRLLKTHLATAPIAFSETPTAFERP